MKTGTYMHAVFELSLRLYVVERISSTSRYEKLFLHHFDQSEKLNIDKVQFRKMHGEESKHSSVFPGRHMSE